MGVLVNMLLALTWCMCAVNPVGSQVNFSYCAVGRKPVNLFYVPVPRGPLSHYLPTVLDPQKLKDHV